MGKNPRIDEVKTLAKDQLGRLERLGTGSATVHVAEALAPDEQPIQLFGAQIDGKGAIVALTDRRILAGYGFMPRTVSIEFGAINQVETGLTSVTIRGSGVELHAKAVGRQAEFLAALQARRAGTAAAPASPASGVDPAEQLTKLAALRDAGVLTEDEFAAKKAEILARI